jgi:adenylylsulfate kinase
MICADCGIEITPEIQVDIAEFKDICHPCYKKKPKHVCVDFDGVLAEYKGWMGPYHLGEPRPGAMEFLKSIADLGIKVIILTTRDPAAVHAWTIHHDMHGLVDRVTRQKPPALAYIDDRAICFEGDFGAVLWKLVRFTPYWRR